MNRQICNKYSHEHTFFSYLISNLWINSEDIIISVWIFKNYNKIVSVLYNNISADPVAGQVFSSDESSDEKNDVEIFRAVVESMKEWELHKKLHHRTKREVSRVCYDVVGCFEDTEPFSYLEMLPSPPRDVGTRWKRTLSETISILLL